MELTGVRDMKSDMYFLQFSLIVVNMGLFVMLILGIIWLHRHLNITTSVWIQKSCEIYHMYSNSNCRDAIAIY